MKKKYEKYIKDGKVAVLVSPGYGAGWSTWNSDYRDELLFDKEIVQRLLEKKPIKKFIKEKYGNKIYAGGADQLIVEWVPQGCRFKVDEYDGFESLEFADSDEFQSA